ncbi:MBL fold metallo-hydrolase [Sphingobacterium multivorum]|uniref:MBL fold metallo-hydrolase n=1 Tax=Sphingobacterium multivorum TaxID=28454 RepID=UPI00345E9956
MIIKQFEYKPLAHFSYAILSEKTNELVLVDPARDPQPYYDFARQHNAAIVAVIETHPHADFVSSHLEIAQKTGAVIYTSQLAQAKYPHQAFDDLSVLSIGELVLKALNTPGHSPDSISIVLENEGNDYAVFTGDTLFIGDCGRPDLREEAGSQTASREELAQAMYHSLNNKLKSLAEDVIVYPAHGAGSLCGKSLKDAQQSTIGEEKNSNWSLQEMPETEFVYALLEDQPFIPAYFGFNVQLNLEGANPYKSSVEAIQLIEQPTSELLEDSITIDGRNKDLFKESHLPHSINLMTTGSFETWLGTLVKPEESFYVTAGDKETLLLMIKRAAAIGYEQFIEAAFIFQEGKEEMPVLDLDFFKDHKAAFTIVDVRNDAEVKAGKIFPESIAIPLSELMERKNEIPTDKPIVVHCAGGFRSAAASSILSDQLDKGVQIFDLSEHIKKF